MPLQKQVIDIPLGQGMDTKTDPILLPPGKLTSLVDAKFDKIGRISKRNGYYQIDSTAAWGAVPYKSSALVLKESGGQRVLSYAQSATNVTAATLVGGFGSVDSLIVTAPQLEGAGSAWVFDVNKDSVANLSGNSRVVYSTLNTASTAVIDGTGPLHNLKLANMGANTMLVIQVSNTGLNTHAMSATASSITSITVACGVAASNSTIAVWDCCGDGSGAGYVVAKNSSNTKVLTLTKFTTAGSVTSVSYTVANGTTQIDGVACCWNSDQSRLTVAYENNWSMGIVEFDANLASAAFSMTNFGVGTSGRWLTMAAASNTNRIMVGATIGGTNPSSKFYLLKRDGTYIANLYATNATLNSGIYRTTTANSANTSSTATDVYYAVGFLADSDTYAVFRICESNTAVQEVSRFNYGKASSLVSDLTKTATLGNFAENGTTGVANFGIVTRTSFNDGVSTVVTQSGIPGIATLNTKANGLVSTGVAPKLIAGSHLLSVDGSTCFRNGFANVPGLSMSLTTMGTGTVSGAGVYQFCSIFERIDSLGFIHRSAPSSVVSISATASSAIYASVTQEPTSFGPLSLTQQNKAVLYATEADGEVFYRVTEAFNGTSTFNFSITGSGTSIAGNEVLYSQSEPENYQPGSVVAICSDSNRVYVIPGEDRLIVLPSKPLDGVNACAFYPDVYRALPAIGGPGTALARMDGKLFAFKKSAVFVAGGDGPDVTGANDTLSDFESLPFAVGAYDQRSVCVTPYGVVTYCPTGIWLIDRGMQAIPLGEDIKTEILDQTTAKNCSSMCFVGDTEELYIVFDDSSSGSTYSLKYDFKAKAWTKLSNLRGLGFVHAEENATDGISTAKTYFVPNPNNANYIDGVYAESNGSSPTFADEQKSDTKYSLLLNTGWIHTSSIQGLARLYKALITGTSESTHTLQVRIAYDYESSFSETHTITSANATTGSTPYDFVVPFARQKCTAVMLEISDTLASAGAGYTITGLSLEVGVKPGLFKTTSTKVAT